MYHYVRDSGAFPVSCNQGPLDRAVPPATRLHPGALHAHHRRGSTGSIGVPKKDLPANSILLTFDDGYSDDFANVYPLLDARGIQGCSSLLRRQSSNTKYWTLTRSTLSWQPLRTPELCWNRFFPPYLSFAPKHELKTREEYLQEMTGQHRYDTGEVTVLKRLLQRELPEPIRAEIVRRLFAAHVPPTKRLSPANCICRSTRLPACTGTECISAATVCSRLVESTFSAGAG